MLCGPHEQLPLQYTHRPGRTLSTVQKMEASDFGYPLRFDWIMASLVTIGYSEYI